MSRKSKASRPKSTAVLSTMVLLVIFAVFTPKTLARYSGGTGEPNNPYQIATPEDLNDIGNHTEDWNKHFILVNDVNLAEYTGTQFNIIGKWFSWDDPNNKPFTGVFDGNDYKVCNFTWDSNGIECVGLFRYVDGEGQIKNVGMENVYVNIVKGHFVGGLCGYNDGTLSDCNAMGTVTGGYHSYQLGGLCGFNSYRGTIIGCYTTGSVTGRDDSMGFLGGLCGVNRGTISSCYATGSVTGGDGSDILGGLCGENDGTISACYATGAVTGGFGSFHLGGLCGCNFFGTISNCYATGAVTGGVNSRSLGGLCGGNLGTINDCYATGNVTGRVNSRSIGGLCGMNGAYDYLGVCPISGCYATGAVTGGVNSRFLGGLCGEHLSYSPISSCYARGSVTGGDNSQVLGGLCGESAGPISACYTTGKVTGGLDSRYLGGLVGLGGRVANSFWDIETSDINYSDGGTGKTTVEMKTKSNFTDAGWDFVEIWLINEGATYPVLRQEIRSDLNGDGGVDLKDLAILASHWLEEPP